MGLENPTCWNSENQVYNPKSSTILSKDKSPLSLSICHLGYTKSTLWTCTGENSVEEIPVLLTAALKVLGDTWSQTAPKDTKQCQEDRVCFDWPWKTIHVVTAITGWSYLEDLIKLSICQTRRGGNKAVRRHSKLTYRG